MNTKVKTRREKVSELLIKNYSEIEIAATLDVSRQTIVRDVSFLKKLSQGWLDGLAKDGFVFEYKLTLQKIKENGAGLQSLLAEAKDVWQKLAIRKAIEQNAKLYLELLGETPTIHAYRKAIKVVQSSVSSA